MEPSVYSIIPPLVAIGLAFLTRRVLTSLFLGLVTGALILHRGQVIPGLLGTLQVLTDVVRDGDNVRILLFSILIGAVMDLVNRSGGVQGFVNILAQPGRVDSKRKAGILTTILGSLLFIEGSLQVVITAMVANPLFRPYRTARAKIAFLVDATCAPMKVLIPLNGWGAYLITQMHQNNVAEPAGVLVRALPFFFYPILIHLLCWWVVLTGKDWGPMKAAEANAHEDFWQHEAEKSTVSAQASARDFLIPLALLVSCLFIFMTWTGQGRILSGDGARSILYAILITLGFMFFYYGARKVVMPAAFFKGCFTGMRHLLDIVFILWLAFGINMVCRELQTGVFIGSLLQTNVMPQLIPVLIYLLSCFVSFATGTSWGTFAIMLAIAIPVAQTLGLPLPLMVGAVVSGGVWGDQTSPISDTTVLSALATDCPLMDHVRTQFPYALAAALIAFVLFLAWGFFLLP